MDDLPAECAPVQEHLPGLVDPVEAVRVPDRGICELCRELEL